MHKHDRGIGLRGLFVEKDPDEHDRDDPKDRDDTLRLDLIASGLAVGIPEELAFLASRACDACVSRHTLEGLASQAATSSASKEHCWALGDAVGSRRVRDFENRGDFA